MINTMILKNADGFVTNHKTSVTLNMINEHIKRIPKNLR